MSEETTRGRSPNCPKYALEQAIEISRRLYKEVSRSKFRGEIAAKVFGYASLNGSALTLIGALSQYGLLDRDDNGNLSISSDAIALLFPIGESQRLELIRKAAQKPKVFSELLSGGYDKCSESVLSSHLIQKGFSEDAAQRIAIVFKENVSLAKLGANGNDSQEQVKNEAEIQAIAPEKGEVGNLKITRSGSGTSTGAGGASGTGEKLREFTFPLPTGMAALRVPFPLTEDDFESLMKTLVNFKEGLVKVEVPMIDANHSEYEKHASGLAESGIEFDLVNFSYSHDITFVMDLAKKHGFRPKIDIAKSTVQFRKIAG